MEGFVIVYCFAIAGFHFVFYCYTSVFSPAGPLWSWLGEGVFKLYLISPLGLLRI